MEFRRIPRSVHVAISSGRCAGKAAKKSTIRVRANVKRARLLIATESTILRGMRLDARAAAKDKRVDYRAVVNKPSTDSAEVARYDFYAVSRQNGFLWGCKTLVLRCTGTERRQGADTPRSFMEYPWKNVMEVGGA